MTAARPTIIGLSAFAALTIALVGCTAVEPAAPPDPTPTGETSVELIMNGPAITGTGPTEPYPGVDFPLQEGMRSVTIDIECAGDGLFYAELGDSMALGQAPLRGTCDGTTSLVWPITEKTEPTFTLWVPDGVEWTATPHFSTAEFVRDEAIAAECEAFGNVYSALWNADSGYVTYQAFDETEWKARVDAAVVELESLVKTSDTAMADSFAQVLAAARGEKAAPGAWLSESSTVLDPITDTCNTNHSQMIVRAEFGG